LRTKSLARLPVTRENYEIEVVLSYDEGGMNYISGQDNARGYYLSARPQERKNGMVVYEAFSGVKTLIDETKRFSQAKFDKLAESLKGSETYDKLVQNVLERQCLTLSTKESSGSERSSS
jgi:hypothetical protein